MSNKQILTQQLNEDKSLTAAVNRAVESRLMDTDGMIPAIVVAYDRKSNIATVKPAIHIVKTDGVTRSRNPVTRISVLSMGGGNFMINFPVAAGDLGWIVAGDRDISLYKEALAEQPPNSSRVRNFADGLFIPDVMRKYTIAAEDSAAMVIQSTDGATKISLRSDNIKIATSAKLLVDVPESQFTGNLTVDKNLVVSGTTKVNGGFTAATGAPCSLPAEATVDGINVKGHGHEQNGDSGRTSGGMEA